MSDYQNNSIFWVETSKINPNPFQPRRDFNEKALEDLADSLRQYGVLQPLVVTRKEETTENGGISVSYELIAGERRLRAAKIARLEQVPVIIRKDTNNKIKLELAIIENLQREDLNPIDRALAFEQLYKQFNLTHAEIGKKMGKSRVYVSNSLRLLSLPDQIKQGLMNGRITEGHTRPLLMLSDKPEEQLTLYKEITIKRLSVRDSEKIARSIAQDKVRKKKFVRDPKIRDYEKRLSENLGTRVQIEQKENGGKITIDYFSVNDLEKILSSIKKIEYEKSQNMMEEYIKNQEKEEIKGTAFTHSSIYMKDDSSVLESEEHKKGLPSESTSTIKKLPEFTHKKDEELSLYREELLPYEKKEEEDIIPIPYVEENFIQKKNSLLNEINDEIFSEKKEEIINSEEFDLTNKEKNKSRLQQVSRPIYQEDEFIKTNETKLPEFIYRTNEALVQNEAVQQNLAPIDQKYHEEYLDNKEEKIVFDHNYYNDESRELADFNTSYQNENLQKEDGVNHQDNYSVQDKIYEQRESSQFTKEREDLYYEDSNYRHGVPSQKKQKKKGFFSRFF